MPMGIGPGIGIGFGGSPRTYAEFVASLAPELYLRFNGDANDSSGHARNGTTHAAPTLTAIGALAYDANTCGKFIKASSQYISIPNFTGGYAAFSYGVWVRSIALASLDVSGGRVFAQRNGTAWVELYVNQDGSVSLYDGSFARMVAPAGTITDGTWTFISGTISGSGSNANVTYINGVAVGLNQVWVNNTYGGEFEVGRTEVTAGNFANFWIDELMITQQLLSAAQHLAAYNLGKKTAVTAAVTVNGTKARFTFSQPTTAFNGLGDFSTFKVNASGGGLVSPTAATSISSTVVDFTYASSVVSTNAWQISDEPAAATISFGSNKYLKAPQSGTAA